MCKLESFNITMLRVILWQLRCTVNGIKNHFRRLIANLLNAANEPSLRDPVAEQPLTQQTTDFVMRARAALHAGHRADAHDYASNALEYGAPTPLDYYQLGEIFLELEILDDAEYCLRMALNRNRTLTTAYLHLGNCHLKMRRYPEAVEAFSSALDRHTDLVEAHKGIARSYIDQGRFSASLNHLEKVLTSIEGPPLLDAYFQLAKVAHKAGNFVASRKYCATVLSQRPNWVSARACLALIQRSEGNLSSASSTIDRLMLDSRGFLVGQWIRGILRLSQYQFDVAWEDYDVGIALGERKFRYSGQRTWNGEALAGKTILVYGEQGLGDEILFASCLKEVIEIAGKTIIECNPKLVSLFEVSFPTAIVCVAEQHSTANWIDGLPKWDVETPIGSLPMFLRRSMDSFRRNRYLKTNPDRVQYWNSRLLSLGAGLTVGISWRGGTAWTGSRERSIDLRLWAPILAMPGIHLVNLQYGDYRDEVSVVAKEFGRRIYTWDDALASYEETASLVDALDLVISVQTAVVHLAGALGKRVFALIPVSPEWRYGAEGNEMIWYENVRLFRQEKQNDWSQVICNVVRELESPVSLCGEALPPTQD